jgi:uncharacterized cupin superfamily protein
MAIPDNTVAPSFTGTLRTLATQTGNAGTWNGSPTFAYQWQRAEPVRDSGELVEDNGEVVTGAWENIAGATSSTYKLLASETGYMVRLRVIGTNGDGSATAYSDQDGPIATFMLSGFIRGAISGTISTNHGEDED